MNKSTLRKSIRDRRKQLSADFISKASWAITQKVLALPVFKKSQHIAYYLSHENEVETRDMVCMAIAEGKQIYLPVFHDHNTLAFYLLTEKTVFEKNKWGIHEPVIDALSPVSSMQLDLIVLPVVAFDDKGNRLGRGAGAYDRYLQFTKTASSDKRPYLLGLAYEFQKVDQLTSDTWDVPMDAVVTEGDE